MHFPATRLPGRSNLISASYLLWIFFHILNYLNWHIIHICFITLVSTSEYRWCHVSKFSNAWKIIGPHSWNLVMIVYYIKVIISHDFNFLHCFATDLTQLWKWKCYCQFLYKNRLQCKEQVAIAMICEVHKQPNVELSFHLYHNYSGDS